MTTSILVASGIARMLHPNPGARDIDLRMSKLQRERALYCGVLLPHLRVMAIFSAVLRLVPRPHLDRRLGGSSARRSLAGVQPLSSRAHESCALRGILVLSFFDAVR